MTIDTVLDNLYAAIDMMSDYIIAEDCNVPINELIVWRQHMRVAADHLKATQVEATQMENQIN